MDYYDGKHQNLHQNKVIVQGIEPWIMLPQNKAFQLSLSYTNHFYGKKHVFNTKSGPQAPQGANFKGALGGTYAVPEGQ